MQKSPYNAVHTLNTHRINRARKEAIECIVLNRRIKIKFVIKVKKETFYTKIGNVKVSFSG